MASASAASERSEDSRRNFLKIGAGVVGGLIVGGAVAYIAKPSTTSTTTETSTTTQTGPGSTTTSTVTGSPSTVTSTITSTSTGSSAQIIQGFLTLSTVEATVLAAAAEVILPSDSNGVGAKEAGSIFFIDRQLDGRYGRSGNMYTSGPFVQPNATGPITVDGITYSEGTVTSVGLSDGFGYQYPIDLRTFWNLGLTGLDAYAQSAYNNTFDQLSASDQVRALTDLFNNKPTSFNNIKPSDFAWELFFMTWNGFLMDPIHGGNVGMVGWDYTAFSGVNNGNFYGEGHTYADLMVATTPTKLGPVSLAQFQAAAGYLPTTGDQ